MESSDQNAESATENADASSRSISITGHFDNLLKHLMEKKILCDITLVAGADDGDKKAKFPVHRNILSASSEYFCTMFTGSFKESDKSEVILANVKADTLKSIINFCYTGKIQLNEENVQVLIEASTEYRFQQLVTVCSEYMTSLLCPENCIGFMDFAKLYSLKDLITKSNEMFAIKFTAISKGDEFKKVSLERLKSILAMDRLNVQSEAEIADAINIWINYDDKRKEHVHELFKLMRLVLLDQKKIEELMEEFKGTETEDLLKNILLWRSKREMPEIRDEHLMVFGGQSSSTSLIEFYCTEICKWKYWKHADTFSSYTASVVWNNEIYFICTVSTKKMVPQTKLCKLNVASDAFEEFIKSWSIPTFSAFVVGEGIHSGVYICYANEAHRFDGESWHSMTFKCNDANTAFAIVGEFIYCTSWKDNRLAIDKYHISSPTPKWVKRSFSSIDRSQPKTVVLNNYIYLLGGFQDKAGVKMVERYDTEDDSWTLLSEMPGSIVQRLSLCNSTIYAIFEDNAVHEYDDKMDIWTKMPPFNEIRNNPHLLSLNIGSQIATK